MPFAEPALARPCAPPLQTALDLAAKHARHKVPAIHLKHAMSLEDEGSFAAAEAAFVRAEKPREAIEMHLHSRDWAAAVRAPGLPAAPPSLP